MLIVKWWDNADSYNSLHPKYDFVNDYRTIEDLRSSYAEYLNELADEKEWYTDYKFVIIEDPSIIPLEDLLDIFVSNNAKIDVLTRINEFIKPIIESKSSWEEKKEN